MVTLDGFIKVALSLLGVYFSIAMASYGVLILLSYRAIRRRRRELAVLPARINELLGKKSYPSCSVIVPAYNEEVVIEQTVQMYLAIRYPDYEIIVVDDGSTDGTFARLSEAFSLEARELERFSKICPREPLATYQSATEPRLKVVKQRNHGKAAAVNTALDFARGELVAVSDADSIPEHDALLRMAIPFIDDPERMAGVGCTLRILNGAHVSPRGTIRGSLPHGAFAMFQVLEYIRAFYFGRMGWDEIGGTVLISGGFGMFRRATLVSVGGYSEGALTEDLDLVLKLRLAGGKAGVDYRFRSLPEPLCWTQAPSTLRALVSQRLRWQRGLIRSLNHYSGMFGRYRFGTVGLLTLPYFFCFEWMEALVRLITYAIVALGVARGLINVSEVAWLAATTVAYCLLTSSIGIIFEETNYARHHRRKSLWRFLFFALIDPLTYQHLTWLFRLYVMLPFWSERWGTQVRERVRRPAKIGRPAL